MSCHQCRYSQGKPVFISQKKFAWHFNNFMAVLKIMISVARACSGIQTQPCLCRHLALFTKPPFTTASLKHPISVLCFSVLIKFLSPLSSPSSHFFGVCYFFMPRLESPVCKVNSGESICLSLTFTMRTNGQIRHLHFSFQRNSTLVTRTGSINQQ